MMRVVIPLLPVALLVACATRPAIPPASPAPAATQTAPATSTVGAAALNPVGTFDFTAVAPDGSTSKGTIVITGSASAYSGKVELDGMGWIDLTRITVEGQTMTTAASLPDGTVVTTVTFTGDAFTGTWMLQGVQGTISGKRR